MRRHSSLSVRILGAQIAVLAVTSAIGLTLWALQLRHVLDQQYEQRALAIAQTVASSPDVQSTLTKGDPQQRIDGIAEQMRAASGATYVVVVDRNGVRYSHPNPTLIGQRVEVPLIVLDGNGHVGIDHGSLGRSANGKAPIFGTDHTVIGMVSVGVRDREVSSAMWSMLPGMVGYLAIAVAIGVIAADLVARRLKRQTFGLELHDLAALVQEREATLHGIREGVVALDRSGRVTLMNDQAQQLLGIAFPLEGMTVDKLVLDDTLRDLLSPRGKDKTLTDQIVLVGGRLLVVSRRKVVHAGVDLGSVITLRDRTELEAALRELDDVRSLTEALRAQQHEFSNRMHVLAGLLELGRGTEAMSYAHQINGATAEVAADLQRNLDDPHLVALLLAKYTVAAERGATLVVDCPSPVHIADEQSEALVTIVGNLVDNAVDAVAGAVATGGPAHVTVSLTTNDDRLVIEVADTGPGIPADAREFVFAKGWSTKATPGRRSRGLGLALVRQLADRLGGTVSVDEGPGARFRVAVPHARRGVPA